MLYQASVKIEKDNGKYVSEEYVVQAESVTEADKMVNEFFKNSSFSFRVASCKEMRAKTVIDKSMLNNL